MKIKGKKRLRENFSFNICGEQRSDLQQEQSMAASTGGAAVAQTQPWLFPALDHAPPYQTHLRESKRKTPDSDSSVPTAEYSLKKVWILFISRNKRSWVVSGPALPVARAKT